MTAYPLPAPNIIVEQPASRRAPSLRLLRALALKRRLEGGDMDRDVPLCVAVEGALVRGRITQEAALTLLCTRPGKLLPLLFGTWRHPAQLKARLGEMARMDPAILPFRQETLRFLRDQRARGRTLVLVGADYHGTVRAVADYLGIFTYSLGSDGDHELSAASRARLLCSIFGPAGFDYVGEGTCDIPAWATARRAIIASPAPRVLDHPTWNSQTADILVERRRRPFAWLDALRPSRWPRSLLIFAPLLALGVPAFHSLVALYCAFCALCLVAAASDLVADMAHLSEDRRDPLTRRRPLASGHLEFDRALVLAGFVAALGFVLAAIVSPVFAGWLVLYPVLALAYAFWLKRVAGLDVLGLAALDLHRLTAGAIVLGVTPFFWQIAFATPFFIGAAAWHRHAALVRVGLRQSPAERAECTSLPLLGMATGYVSALVLALYAHSGDPDGALGPPLLSWFLCPILLFGVTIAWTAGRVVLARIRAIARRALCAAAMAAMLLAEALILFRG
ncbi:MAG TPA: UbiA family prenyltransferase [Rhizomicrobium sp.]|jgi:4-hydroxybenzoate polyprenyltransferase|nr:UbiA family prenyltransferase [Rhizomicrobium sp.]